ncbi:hypothetical protein EV359DRAFT_62544 [Lentinula novae-zelandiae]|nr:hypothetical protein EV359DRAFT_62544 [Lentinula novae-zelandiae]
MIRSKRRYYDSLAPDSDDYDDSQNLTTPKCPHLQQQNFTAKREMAELAHSLALDDDVGSQEFIENLFKSRGLDPALVQREYFEDGASDIDNEVHIEEPQSQIVHYSSPVPSSPSKPCISLDYCITVNEDGIVELGNQERNNNLEYCTLNQQLSSSRDLNDRYGRKLYRQEVHLKRLQDSLFTAINTQGQMGIPIMGGGVGGAGSMCNGMSSGSSGSSGDMSSGMGSTSLGRGMGGDMSSA